MNIGDIFLVMISVGLAAAGVYLQAVARRGRKKGRVREISFDRLAGLVIYAAVMTAFGVFLALFTFDDPMSVHKFRHHLPFHFWAIGLSGAAMSFLMLNLAIGLIWNYRYNKNIAQHPPEA